MAARNGDGWKKPLPNRVSPAVWAQAQMMAGQPKAKQSAEWFCAARVVAGYLQTHLHVPYVAVHAVPGLFVADGCPSIAMVFRKDAEKEYVRIPAGMISTLFVAARVGDYIGGREYIDPHVAKVVWLDGVISRRRVMESYSPRKDRHYAVGLSRFDPMRKFADWMRREHGTGRQTETEETHAVVASSEETVGG